MSWMQKLYETYENCQSMIGVGADDNAVPLLPICHTTQKAQIEIVLDQDGNFKKARVIPKNEARTIIPCTESSGGRTSGKAPHPLCDKLQYIAADYKKYGGEKKHYYQEYITQLEAWCQSPNKHPKGITVLKYLKKGKVIEDLIADKILFIKDGKLMKKWGGDKKTKPSIFFLFQNQEWQAESFVRWIIDSPGELEINSWRDKSLWESWIKHYLVLREQKKALCYITGEKIIAADQHPKKIRNDGDGAKIISSGKSKDSKGKEKVDDSCGFTFLGRFLSAEQASGVSLEVSQKAHFALRWLIYRQGYKKGDQVIVAWATSGAVILQPTDDPLKILGFDELPNNKSSSVLTAQDLALKLKKRIAGYGKEIGDSTGIVVMGLDSATPGRLSITFYRELTGSDFLQRIDHWHESCAWIHSYGYEKETKRHFTFVGAPAPDDIAEAAYGHKVDEKLKKSTVARILPCIIDGQQIPRDLVESAVRRASNRVGMEEWEWNKTLSIACALYRKYYSREGYGMALDRNRKTRDYLYGRLLAAADCLERFALFVSEKKRDTNSARLMQRFSDRPFSTWKTIELLLMPYKARLGGRAKKYLDTIDEVMNLFDPIDNFTLDKPLSGEFLLAYHCQREDLKPRKGEPESIEDVVELNQTN